ncbi:hypothetical protein GN956_G1124 [Arapaima gigas]
MREKNTDGKGHHWPNGSKAVRPRLTEEPRCECRFLAGDVTSRPLSCLYALRQTKQKIKSSNRVRNWPLLDTGARMRSPVPSAQVTQGAVRTRTGAAGRGGFNGVRKGYQTLWRRGLRST